MDDKELLELAAKAAGINASRLCDRYDNWDEEPVLISKAWNPLTDDGDALRLAVKLRLCVYTLGNYSEVKSGAEQVWTQEIHGADPYAATRRAIVRAAAEIGKGVE